MNHFEKFESYVPYDLLSLPSLALAMVVLTGVVIFRYFLVAGGMWILFYKYNPASLRRRQIYFQLPSIKSQRTEIKWSLLTSVLFGASGAILGVMWQLGWTRLYLPFNSYPLWYFPVSFFLLSLIHDFYFYVTHRFLHIPWVYRRAHYAHHQSLTPSPWASFSFHPWEGLIEALPVPLIVLFLPVHPLVLLAYLTAMTVSSVTNHLGFEILPSGSARHPIGKYLISGVHHSQHHKSFKHNYGLFYTFWDRWFETEHSGYADQFDQVVKKSK